MSRESPSDLAAGWGAFLTCERGRDGRLQSVSAEGERLCAAGINICPNSGVAVAGARRLVEEGVIGKSESAVIIATAHGGKFATMTLPYHTDEPARGAFSNPPRITEPTIEAVRAALASPAQR